MSPELSLNKQLESGWLGKKLQLGQPSNQILTVATQPSASMPLIADNQLSADTRVLYISLFGYLHKIRYLFCR